MAQAMGFWDVHPLLGGAVEVTHGYNNEYNIASTVISRVKLWLHIYIIYGYIITHVFISIYICDLCMYYMSTYRWKTVLYHWAPMIRGTLGCPTMDAHLYACRDRRHSLLAWPSQATRAAMPPAHRNLVDLPTKDGDFPVQDLSQPEGWLTIISCFFMLRNAVWLLADLMEFDHFDGRAQGISGMLI